MSYEQSYGNDSGYAATGQRNMSGTGIGPLSGTNSAYSTSNQRNVSGPLGTGNAAQNMRNDSYESSRVNNNNNVNSGYTNSRFDDTSGRSYSGTGGNNTTSLTNPNSSIGNNTNSAYPAPTATGLSGPSTNMTATGGMQSAQDVSSRLEAALFTDNGIDKLLNRLKQSIYSARDFSNFLRERVSLEEKYAQGFKRVLKNTSETIRRPDARQGSYMRMFSETLQVNDRLADNSLTFANGMHIMSEELRDIAENADRGRKQWKHSAVDAEKRLTDSESAMHKARDKYDSVAAQYERARIGERSGKFGLKGKSPAQQEDALKERSDALDGEYTSRRNEAQRLRQDYEQNTRPTIVQSLSDLIAECDAALAAQIAKLASMSEKHAVSNGLTISPLRNSTDANAAEPRGLRSIANDIDNRKDFHDYVLGESSGANPLDTRTDPFGGQPSPGALPGQTTGIANRDSLVGDRTSGAGLSNFNDSTSTNPAGTMGNSTAPMLPPINRAGTMKIDSPSDRLNPSNRESVGAGATLGGMSATNPNSSLMHDRSHTPLNDTTTTLGPRNGYTSSPAGASSVSGLERSRTDQTIPSSTTYGSSDRYVSGGAAGAAAGLVAGTLAAANRTNTTGPSTYGASSTDSPLSGRNRDTSLSNNLADTANRPLDSTSSPGVRFDPNDQYAPARNYDSSTTSAYDESPSNYGARDRTTRLGSSIDTPTSRERNSFGNNYDRTGPNTSSALDNRNTNPTSNVGNTATPPSSYNPLSNVTTGRDDTYNNSTRGLPSQRDNDIATRSNLPANNPVFGVHLDELFRRDGTAVPTIVYKCTEAIDRFGIDTEGIYRVAGNTTTVKQLKSEFDHNASRVDLSNPANFNNDIHSVATVLKNFLRELPDPLLTRTAYQSFIQAARHEDSVLRRDTLHQYINSLPDANYATLRTLTLHLHRVGMNHHVNKMGMNNLAIVFGPSVLGGSNVADAGWQTKILETILHHTYEIFDPDE